jgi:hypothetical protein
MNKLNRQNHIKERRRGEENRTGTRKERRIKQERGDE